MHRRTKITFIFWGAILCFIAAALSEDAQAQAFCVPHSAASDDIDSWISQGLAIAGLPDDQGRHGALKSQAWLESNFEPDVSNGTNVGLMQVEPITWGATDVGSEYPFSPCATDPVISAAVRAELFEMGHFN